MTTQSARVEVVAADNNRCGEAPVWDAARRRLLWADLSSNLVYQLSPASGEKSVISRDLNACGIALDRSGQLVFGGGDGLHLWQGQGRYRTLVTEHEGEKLVFNDLTAGPGGRVYAGTLYWGAADREKLGKLYLIGPGGSVQVVDDGIELANGLGFSADGRTLYFADSAARKVYAYGVHPADGTLSNKRTFASVPTDQGIPDGLTVDGQDHVWCAMWYGSQVVRYDPDGAVERRIAVPARQTSSVAFGGDDLTDLYVTSAAEPWPSEFAPPGFNPAAPDMGGSLYRVRLNVTGKPEYLAALAT